MASPPHILLLNVFFAPNSYGGATMVAEAVARALVRDHGWRITAVSTAERPDLTPYSVMRTEVAGIQNHVINLRASRSYAERYDNAEVTGILAGLIADLEPDLLHAHCIQDIGIGAIAEARTRGLPVVLSVHDFWWLCEYQFMQRPDGQYCGQYPVRIDDCRGCADKIALARTRFARLHRAVGQTDLVTFPSRFARDLSVASGFPGSGSVVWENGIYPPGEAFFAAQAARRATDPRLVFGYLGGPSRIKGWPLVKAAFTGLGRGDFAGLLVDASLDQSWWTPAEFAGMDGNWQVRPRFAQSELDSFYAEIDVLLFPSQWKETFGLAVREAAARGIRVIQTDSGGTTEWPGADPARMLKIGEGPHRLREEVLRCLDAPAAHPAPVAVTSFADQAAAFTRLATPLMA